MNTVTVKVSDNRIADMLCGAFEGGSNYWIDSVKITKGKGDGKPYGEERDNPSYLIAPFSTGGSIEVFAMDGDPGGTVNQKSITRGLRIMAKDQPRHFFDLLTENDDATTADVFLQCCLFGKIIYG